MTDDAILLGRKDEAMLTRGVKVKVKMPPHEQTLNASMYKFNQVVTEIERVHHTPKGAPQYIPRTQVCRSSSLGIGSWNSMRKMRWQNEDTERACA